MISVCVIHNEMYAYYSSERLCKCDVKLAKDEWLHMHNSLHFVL